MKIKNCIYIVLTYFLASCTAMDEHYKDFIADGPINYIGKVDSIDYRSGINSVQILWKVSSDPATKYIRIYWMEEGVRDSVTETVPPNFIGKKMAITIHDISPGSYTFQIVAFDNLGNKSVPVELNAVSLNESVLENLWPHSVSGTNFNNDVLTINWAEVSDTTYISSTVLYEDLSGSQQKIEVSFLDKQTVIDDYKPGSQISYYSTYQLPKAMSMLDSKIERLMIQYEYSKSDWTAISSGYDEPTDRGPWLAIDSDPATVWHMTKESGYPHSVDVDMKEVLKLTGITFMQRQNLDGPVTVAELLVSVDGVNWQSQGEYNLQAIITNQFLAFDEELEARFFRIVAKSDSKGGNFTAVSEVGAYVEW